MERSETSVRAFEIRGQVQGVGFRPFLYRLARELALAGCVRNVPGGVHVEVAGPGGAIEDFARRLPAEAPALARVEAVLPALPSRPSWSGFVILDSEEAGGVRGEVTVDTAVCPACVAEMRDPGDRRHGHGLINCTDCGPRYTILLDLPYDRPRTTMAGFPMCDACAREYRDPEDRRFHAQPVCCPRCGPRVVFLDAAGGEREGDPVDLAAGVVRDGGLLLVKGLGGYHLAADARNEAAVGRAREAKGREARPFALLVRDVEAAGRLAALSPAAREALLSPAAPIVLAPRRAGEAVAAGVAPGNHRLGIMLPNTPLQHLLADRLEGPLVLTSANLSGDPLIAGDREAREAFGAAVGGTLTHDRPIHRAVDDSVVLDAPGGPVAVRRARGCVPAPLALPLPAPSHGLALGGDLKSVVAVVRQGKAVAGPHLGDLSRTEAFRRFLATIGDLRRLFDVEPEWVAHDPHPLYLSRRHARALARREGLRTVPVQHHHAHLASLMAEHGRTARTLGIVCDGVGYGADGTAWGGEVLAADLVACERLGRLRPLRLPGGDAAAVETTRCAVSWLLDAGVRDHPLPRELPQIVALLRGAAHCPESSGAGRLFDAAAALLGLVRRNRFEAESGLALEAAAEGCPDGPSGEGLLPLSEGGLIEIDHRPLPGALLSAGGPGRAARLFHGALADGLARAAVQASERTGIRVVGLSGGVFGNALLRDLAAERLEAAGLAVLLHREVPANDGGLFLGQAAVAAATLAAERS